MTDDHAGRKTGRVCGALACTVLLVLFLSVKYDFYYDLNDDTMIKDILSGAYTGIPNGYCIQMLYPLSWILALFYRAIPTVPWYGLFLCLCQFFVFFAVALRLMGMFGKRRTKAAALLMLLALTLGLFLRELVILQYSVVSGVCMAGAVFLFMTVPYVDKVALFLRKNLLPLALVVLSFLIRTEVCMMLLPFLLLAGLAKWGGEKKIFTATNFRKYLMLIGMAFLGMLAVYSIDMLAYRDSEWDNFRNFFDARTKLYDFYGLPDYDANNSFFTAVGLSQESYVLLENYNFALDDSIDTWSLEAIVTYQELLAAQGAGLNNTFGFVSKNSLREAVWLYMDQFVKDIRAVSGLLTHPVPRLAVLRLITVAGYIVYIVVHLAAVRGAKKKALWKGILLLAVRSILWLYLYMVDRVLDRVAVPLLLLELVLLVCFVMEDMYLYGRKSDGRQRYMAVIVYSCCMLCIFVAGWKHKDAVQEEYHKRANADVRWQTLMDYCRENGQNYYIVDVYSSTSYNGTPYAEKIFQNVNDSYKNFDICGGWMAKSPLARQKLEKMGIRDLQSVLCGKGSAGSAKTYFVAASGTDLGWIERYYHKRGIDVRAVRVDSVRIREGNIFEIYRLDSGV